MSACVQRILSRVIDMTLSLIGLVILALPFVLLAIAIKLDSRGPVFFRQERVGQDERPFKTWKFRTMAVEAPAEGFGHQVTEDNPFITRVGRLLREWGIDELPQLINVLLGQMSLVGPRPVLPWHVEHYDETQRRRLSVKPGITGWALIHGRNSLPWRKRIELDLWYVDHWSLWLDLKILVWTVIVVLVKREGIYGEGEFDV